MTGKGNHQEFKRSGDPIGFRFAVRGISHFFRTQRNARIQLAVAVLVVAAGLFLGLTATEWMVVVICIAMVLAAEMFNTAIELLTDLVSPEYSEKAGRIKDVAAGAVLLTAVAAIIAGLFIFLPRMVGIISSVSGS